MTDEFLRNHLNFKAIFSVLYMTLTTYKVRFPQDRNCDHFVAYASKNLDQLSIWQQKRIRFFQIQFNFLKPTQHDLITNAIDITTAPSVKKTSTARLICGPPPPDLSTIRLTKTSSNLNFFNAIHFNIVTTFSSSFNFCSTALICLCTSYC